MPGLTGPDAMDVLNEDNAQSYWARSDRFDFALDLAAGRRGHAALAQAIATFLRHMLAVETEIEPLLEVRNAPLAWYVGLDAAATKIGDRLWDGGELDPQTAARGLGLYRLTFPAPTRLPPPLVGEWIYFILA